MAIAKTTKKRTPIIIPASAPPSMFSELLPATSRKSTLIWNPSRQNKTMHMQAHMHAHTNTYIHTHEHMHTNTRAYTCTHTHMRTCTHTHACTHAHTHTIICMHICMYAHTHTRKHSHTNTHTHHKSAHSHFNLWYASWNFIHFIFLSL